MRVELRPQSNRQRLELVGEPRLDVLRGVRYLHVGKPRECLLDEDPQLKARNRWREMDTPAGPIPTLLPPVTLSGFEARLDPVPAVGEHTDRVLAGLGYSMDEIGALRAAGAV